MWLVGFAWFAVNYYLLGFTSLAPTFFTSIASFSLFEASVLAILPVSMIIWVSPITGLLSDRFRSRKKFILASMVLGLLLGPVILLLGVSIFSWSVFLAILGIIWGLAPSAVFASPRDIVGPEFAGPASGILILMVGFASLLAPFITGSLVTYIGWQGALASTAIPSIGGCAAILMVRTLS